MPRWTFHSADGVRYEPTNTDTYTTELYNEYINAYEGIRRFSEILREVDEDTTEERAIEREDTPPIW